MKTLVAILLISAGIAGGIVVGPLISEVKIYVERSFSK